MPQSQVPPLQFGPNNGLPHPAAEKVMLHLLTNVLLLNMRRTKEQSRSPLPASSSIKTAWNDLERLINDSDE